MEVLTLLMNYGVDDLMNILSRCYQLTVTVPTSGKRKPNLMTPLFSRIQGSDSIAMVNVYDAPASMPYNTVLKIVFNFCSKHTYTLPVHAFDDWLRIYPKFPFSLVSSL